MKLQYIAVIFIIIIVPISLVLSEYLNVQIKTINNQSFYAKQLDDATYDTIKAFQFNTIHNRYSSVASSKLRDIKAATNTFFNTLGTTLVRSREDLQEYVPALVFTLYDGYYIYSRNSSKQDLNEYTYELKPYIYYTCEYSIGNKSAIINYTLDNYITVYYYDGNDLHTKSGYLIDGIVKIDDAKVTEETDVEKINYFGRDIIYLPNKNNGDDYIKIENEELKENLMFKEETENGYYSYVVYGNKKVYYNESSNKSYNKYFWYDNNNKKYIYDNDTKNYAESRLDVTSKTFKSTSAKEYYVKAAKFTDWVENNLNWITKDTIKNIELKEQFDLNNKLFNGNYEKQSSNFNEHRMAVIKNSIQSNLITAISTYNSHANTYEYTLPKISEVDWNTISNKVCVISFLQGIPIGTKYFNNYSVVSNSKNQEFIDKNSIYMVGEDDKFHKIGCEQLMKMKSLTGYLNLNFVRQSIKDEESEENYFYPREELGCYECAVSTNLYYTADDIIWGESIKINEELRKKYITALAREKNDLYKSNAF